MKKRSKATQSAIEAIESRLLFAIIYVDALAPGAAHDGTNWSTAFTTLNEALTVASGASHDQILVADGTYTSATALHLGSGIELHGGYAGASDPTAPQNVSAHISKLFGMTVDISGSDDTALLDGLTLTGSTSSPVYAANGNARITNCIFTGNTNTATSGGAIFCSYSSPTISGCTFTNNIVLENFGGGAIYNENSSPTIINCTFTDNDGCEFGGAICNRASSPAVIDCTFNGGAAVVGGQVVNIESSEPTFLRCVFDGSTALANSQTSGMYNYGASPSLTDCLFTNFNSLSGAITNGAGSPTLTECTFRSNSNLTMRNVDTYATLIDCDFIDNHGTQGGAVIDDSSHVSWLGCRFVSNTAGDLPVASNEYRGGAIASIASDETLTDCVFDGNTAEATSTTNAFGGAIYISGANSITIAGCTFSDNAAAGGNGIQPDSILAYGGAIYNSSVSSLAISDCTFTNNAAFRAAGIYNSQTIAVISHSSFSNNSTGIAGGGGGIYNSASTATISDCVFTGNTATLGAAGIQADTPSTTIANSVFESNHGRAVQGVKAISHCKFIENDGGAISTSIGANVSDCVFIRNSAPVGGAMIASGLVTILNCYFLGNMARGGSGARGGALEILFAPATSSVTNCIFAGNSAEVVGGALYLSSAKPKMTNCTFSKNSAGTGGAIYVAGSTSQPTLTNCILWQDTDANPNSWNEISVASGSVSVSYCDIQGGWVGVGNIDIDPQFVRNPTPGDDLAWGASDDDYGDLRLRATSPCIDVGSNADVPAIVTTDIAGNPRIIDTPTVHDPGAFVDLGANEYQSPLAALVGTYLYSASRPTVSITFNGDVDPASLQAYDLSLYNYTSQKFIDVNSLATIAYDANTRVATWKFNTSLLPDGYYHGVLSAGSCGDILGNPLASTYEFDFFVLAGDANHDRVVDVADLMIAAQNWQGNCKVFSQGDFNYDTKVDFLDLLILAENWNKTPAGTTAGFAPMPNILPLSPPPPPPPVVATLSAAAKRTAPKLIAQVL